MKPKLFINFGLPKTSSTNLQKNFYPFIEGINYLGRVQGGGLKGNSEIFNEFNLYIEGGKEYEFNDDRLSQLKKNFTKNLKNKINLISMENWAFPYQKNVKTNKIEIVSQFEKLKRLRKFTENLHAECSFYVVHRKPTEGIVSLFVTAQNRIEKIFGHKYLNFKEFLLKYENKDKDFENMKLFFDVYNINRIKEIFSESELKIFHYNDIKNNPEKFMVNFFEYLNLKKDYSLLKNITTKTGVTPLKDKNYFVKTPNTLFILLKKLLPEFIKEKIKFFISLTSFKSILLNDYEISKEEIEKLRYLIND
jgi:hypothetical protein